MHCEYTTSPLGIEQRAPKLSWTIGCDEERKRGAFQSAYRVIVSDNFESIQKGEGNVWDSGKVESERQVNVECPLRSPRSAARYWWKVKVWDERGEPSDYSKASFWEMGLLEHKDWEGAWIGGGNLLRGALRIEAGRKISRARVYVCGLGYYELTINGKKIGDRVLSPSWTDYGKRVFYDTYDVTEHLRLLPTGEVAIVGLMMGKGRYPPAKEEDMEIAGYGPPVALLQMNIEYDQGTKRQTFFTDGSWLSADGPIVSDDIFAGEDYDATREISGWNLPGPTDSRFGPVQVVEPPKGRLESSATLPPIRIVASIQTRRILCPSPGVFVYDYGQNFSGWVRLKVRGPRGSRVTMRYAELVDEDGNVNTRTNERAESTDHYTLKGEGLEEYEPRFTYHGFRYVELTGFPGAPSTDTLEGRFVHSDVDPSGSFICSSELINRIHESIRWGQLSNLMSIPTDCPQRNERMGWLGDAQYSSEEAIYNFWMPTFYEKWVKDIEETQDSEGSINSVAPAYWIRNPADPAHGMAFIMIPFELYRHYGDLRVLRDHYESMKKYMDFLGSRSPGKILDSFNKHGDYCAPFHVVPSETPRELISTSLYYLETVAMSKISAVLGREEDSVHYAKLASEISEALNSIFLKKRWDRTHDFFLESYGETQTSNVLPLYAGIVPPDKEGEVIQTLVSNIVRQYDGHLETGVIGTKYLFPLLSALGYEDLAYEVAIKTTYPGYGYMVKEGATTLWERWEYLTTYILSSHNHIMFGSIGAWFYSSVAGIIVDESRPGFRHFFLKPRPPSGLTNVVASLHTIRGLISLKWDKKTNPGNFSLEVVIPANCTCSVFIPTKGFTSSDLKEGGTTIFSHGRKIEALPDGIASVKEEGNFIVCEIASGIYSFVVTEAKN